jgi:hypothetical protein
MEKNHPKVTLLKYLLTAVVVIQAILASLVALNNLSF